MRATFSETDLFAGTHHHRPGGRRRLRPAHHARVGGGRLQHLDLHAAEERDGRDRNYRGDGEEQSRLEKETMKDSFIPW